MKVLNFAIFTILFIFLIKSPAQQKYREVFEKKHSRFHKVEQINPILFRAFPVAVSRDSFELYLFTETAYDIHSFQLAHPIYKTDYAWEVLIVDSAGKGVGDISWKEEIRLKEFRQTNQRYRYHFSHNKIGLRPGKYKVSATLSNVYGKIMHKLVQTIQFGFRKDFYASPPLFYTPGEPVLKEDISVPGQPAAVRNHLFFNRPYGLYINYCNLSGKSVHLSLNIWQLTPQKRFLLKTEKDFLAVQNRGEWSLLLPWQKMEEGEYLLEINYAYGGENYRQRISFWVNWFDKPRSLQIPRLAMEPLRLLMDNKEFKERFKGNEAEQLRAFKQFWKAQDPDTTTAFNPVMEEFYSRIDTANVRWGGRSQAGWRTEIGEIYILNGPPDKVEDNSLNPTNPYLIWIYYRPDRNLRYIFKAVDGRKKYQLIKEEEF